MAQQMKDLLWKHEEQNQDSCKIREVLLGRVPDNLAPTRDRGFEGQASQLDQPNSGVPDSVNNVEHHQGRHT